MQQYLQDAIRVKQELGDDFVAQLDEERILLVVVQSKPQPLDHSFLWHLPGQHNHFRKLI